jgi:hypothetical protein
VIFGVFSISYLASGYLAIMFVIVVPRIRFMGDAYIFLASRFIFEKTL